MLCVLSRHIKWIWMNESKSEPLSVTDEGSKTQQAWVAYLAWFALQLNSGQLSVGGRCICYLINCDITEYRTWALIFTQLTFEFNLRSNVSWYFTTSHSHTTRFERNTDSSTAFGDPLNEWYSTKRCMATTVNTICNFNPLKGTCQLITDLTYIFNFWHLGTLALSPERQSAQMLEIKNAG